MTIKRARRYPAPSPPAAVRLRTEAILSRHLSPVWEAVKFKAKQDSEWLAESINDALAGYFGTFEITRAGTPSAHAKWATALRKSAEECLLMLLPERNPKCPPDATSLDTFHALFHVDLLSGLGNAQPDLLGNDSPLDALRGITNAIWLLRGLADQAQKQWSREVVTHHTRRKVRLGILAFISELGCRYQEAFERSPPISPTKVSQFSLFFEAVRKVVIDQKIALLDSFNNANALQELEELTPGAFVAFVRRHRDTLGDRWSKDCGRRYTPERFRAPN